MQTESEGSAAESGAAGAADGGGESAALSLLVRELQEPARSGARRALVRTLELAFVAARRPNPAWLDAELRTIGG
jgi:hypothetical protein